MHAAMKELHRAIQWIGGHVRGFYAAVGVFLLLGLALSAAALGVFALLVRGVASGITHRVDETILIGARRLESGWLDAVALAGAALGSGIATWMVLGLGSVVLWRTRHHYSAALLWVSLLGSRFLNGMLKGAFDRPRPDLFVGDLDLLGWTFSFPRSPSFPSGHAITSVAIYGTLAFLVVRAEPTVRQRRITLAAAAFLILAIGLSRIYLGVHYPSDVLAGYLVGFVWATFCALAIEAIRYFRTRKPRAVSEEAGLEKGVGPIGEALRRRRA